jgi:protein TonB
MLGKTLVASALLHIIVIFAVTFEPPDLKVTKDKTPPLEVVLVNAKTKTAPTKADVLAQANLNRGGNTDKDRKAKSALPPAKNKSAEVTVKPATQAKRAAKSAKAQAEAERKQQRVAELEKQAQELMTQIQSQKKVEAHPTEQVASPQSEQGDQEAAKTLDATALMASSLDMVRLEAQIAKQQEEYQKRPKRKFIGARAQEYRFATYVESWRQKVEKIGNLNYPVEAKEQKLYGRLRMTVSIRADGSIEKLEINQSSGYKVLDDAAKRIVNLAAPFAPFPDNIRKDTDILSITRTWSFTKQDSLSSE